MFRRLLLAGSVLGMASGVIAHADTITDYSLSLDGCSNNACGSGPFGTVHVDEATNNLSATITVTLASNVTFAGTGAGDSLVFDLSGSPAITFSGITSGFEKDPSTPVHASTFGDFTYGVTCNFNGGACQGGSGPTSLSFTITSTNGVTPLVFVENTNGNPNVFFASDVAVTNSDHVINTGNVGAGPGTPVTPPVPEPSSLALLGTGVLGLAGVIRRRFGR